MTPDLYASFLRQVTDRSQPMHVAIFHAVRNIPYGQAGNRDPLSVLNNRRGSCSGKHLLLRDLLRLAGYEAAVWTIYTHFNRAIPLAPSYPEDLAQMVEHDEVDDFHHFVRARIGGQWLNLDATWPDSLAVFGFPVNTDWDGTGHTCIAADAITEYPAQEDIAAFKSELIATLPEEARAKRKRFFDQLTVWMDAAVPPANINDEKS